MCVRGRLAACFDIGDGGRLLRMGSACFSSRSNNVTKVLMSEERLAMTLSCIIPNIIIFTNQGDRTKWGMRVQNTKRERIFVEGLRWGYLMFVERF